jgi:hypothetical protein
VTVQLEDSSGNVLATTRTDSMGRYVFTQLSGPAASVANASGVSATGDYLVRLLLPAGATQNSADPAAITITRGDTNVTGVNFTVTPHAGSTPPSHWDPLGGAMPPALNNPFGGPPAPGSPRHG